MINKPVHEKLSWISGNGFKYFFFFFLVVDQRKDQGLCRNCSDVTVRFHGGFVLYLTELQSFVTV